MNCIKLKRTISLTIISCLIITSTPLQAIAAGINEESQWQEIITTFEGDDKINSLNSSTTTPDAFKNDNEEDCQDEKQFTLEMANEEFKTDRFIIKYKDNIDMKSIIDIPDLDINSETKEYLENISDSIERNSTGEQSAKIIDESNKLDEIQESIPVGIDPTVLELKQTPIDAVTVVGSENMMILDTKNKMTGDEFLNGLKNKEVGQGIEYIQPDYELGMSAVNDPFLKDQWGHYQEYQLSSEETGSESYGIKTKTNYRMDANVLEAWEKTKGKGSIVALLDTGIDTTHVDLTDNLLDGWDFVNNDDSVNDINWKYDQWHATHIAGIIAAEEENGIGVAGVAPEAKILPLKIFQGGVAYTSDIISAIKYAEMCGAKIANCSWGTSYDNPALKEAIENSGMVFVCATGNGSYDIDKYPVYPASYDLDNIISVTSIDQNGKLSRFANYGKKSVDIAAPGRDIYSTTIDNGFVKSSGTSMSAGYVSGALALLCSNGPEKTASELCQRIVASGNRITGLMDKVNNGKELNCGYAVSNNPFANFNSILIEDDDPLPDISPNGDMNQSQNEYRTFAENTVSVKAPMPTARHGLGVISINNKIYAIGGQLDNGYSNVVEEYDPKTNTWTTKTNMPIASSYFGVVKINNKVFVFGGYNGSYLSTVQVYDPSTNTWTTMPTTHNMPVAMKSFAAIEYNGKVYLTGGYNGSNLNTIYEYTPNTGAWIQKQNLFCARRDHVAAQYNGKIYIDGGNAVQGGSTQNLEEIYDITQNTVQQNDQSRIYTDNGALTSLDERAVYIGGFDHWNHYSNKILQESLNNNMTDSYVIADMMHYTRAGLGAAEVNGKVYIIGGKNEQGPVNVVEELDLGWEVKCNLPSEIKNFSSIECNGKLYVFGGESLINNVNQKIKTVYEYNPQSNIWTKMADMPDYRERYALVTAYGKIYLLGGRITETSGASTINNEVYAFNPTGNTWSKMNGFSSPRDDLSATFFDGKIYIVGGESNSLSTVRIVEAYNPLNDSWSLKGNIPQANKDHLLTVLNNKMYLIGGTNRKILEYNQELDSWSVKLTGLDTSYVSNSMVSINDCVFNFTKLLSASREPSIYRYDPKSNLLTYYKSYYLFKKSYGVVTLNNKVYSFDGAQSSANPYLTASPYASKLIEYRPPVAPWTLGSKLNNPSTGMGIATIDEQIYHVGGQRNTSTTVFASNIVSRLDTKSRSWTTLANMKYDRISPAVGAINGKLYVAGGRNQTDYACTIPYVEEYDPVSNTWTDKASMPMPIDMAAYATYNGKLYIFGGTSGFNFLGFNICNSTYIYDPQTNSWTTGAPMPTARYACGAATLSDGKIYVVGGRGLNAEVKALEVYDPNTNTWCSKTDMPLGLEYLGVAGKDSLYVIGGSNNYTGNDVVYEYNPYSDKWFSWSGPGVKMGSSRVAIINSTLYVISYAVVRCLPLNYLDTNYIHMGEEIVNLSGNLARNYVDMSYTSGGFQINISRTYNSLDDLADGNSISKGWTFGFQGRIRSTGSDTLIKLPNGAGYYYKINSDGTYTAKDSRSSLIKRSDGTWVMTTKDLYSYGFNSSGYLTWMKDRNGNTITITVDSVGKVTQITDQFGRQINIDYSSNRIWRITDFAGRVVTYLYNSNGGLSSVTDPMGKITNYSYNSGGFLTDVKDQNNNLIESYTYYDIPTYETMPKLKSVTDALGKIVTYVYDEGEGTITATDNAGRQDITWFDKMLYPIRTKDAEGRETYTEYYLFDGANKYGEQRVSVDRRGNTTYYDRDINGNIIRQINPDSSIKEFSYDEKNNLISEKDETGKFVFYIYDSNKINLIKTAKPLNGTSVFIEGGPETAFSVTANTYYTPTETQTMCGKTIAGLLKTVTDPENHVTTYAYDSNGNIATVKNALNEVNTYQYNLIGWLKQEINIKGYITKYYYDRNGKVIKKILNDGETERTIYDFRGRITQNISPNQYLGINDATSIYDANNVLTNNNLYAVSDIGTRYIYFANGLLQTETDPLNNSTTYTYDKYGNVFTKKMPNGYREYYLYDKLNRITRKNTLITESEYAKTDEYSYAISSDGYFEKTTKHYFNTPNAPAYGITKETYNYADKLTRTDNADGGFSTNQYYANGLLSVSTDSMGRKTYYSYDGLNRQIGKWSEVSAGICCYEGKEYDKNGNLTRDITSTSTVTPNTTPANTRYLSYQYDALGRVVEQTDSMGGKNTYFFTDASDKLTQRHYTSASSYYETEILYNYFGKIKENNQKVDSSDIQTNESVLKTSYTFDKEGNILTETKPDNTITTYTYDSLGRKLTMSKPGINEYGQAATLINTYTYDFRGSILTEKDPLNRITEYTYNLQGFLLKVKDPKNGITYTERTPDNLIVAEVTPKNYTEGLSTDQMTRTVYAYDSMGRVSTESKIYKDSNGQFQTITKSYTYDKNGNLQTSTDGMGFVTTYTYDGMNRQLTVLDPEAKDKGLSFTTKYSYDGLGQKTAEENGVHSVTNYAYNDQGKLLSVVVGGVTNKSCTYDIAGNMLTETDGEGNTINYTYNALGKIRTKVLPGDASITQHTISFIYTRLGGTATETDSLLKKKSYGYDNQSRLISETEGKTDGTNNITKTYRYDIAGNLRFATDGNNKTIEYTYDELNRKQTQKILVTISGAVTAQTTTYEYDANGNQTGTTDWLGNKYSNDYDSIDRLVSKKNPNNVIIEALTYDSNNRQTSSIDALGHVTTFGYDKANRLISKTDPSSNVERKTYDAAGNIKTSTDGRGNVTNYAYDSNNRLTSVTNALLEISSYDYDHAGNLLTQTDGKGNIITYQYNVRNLPTARIDAGGITSDGAIDLTKSETYQYYVDGKLASKTDRNGVQSSYTYDIHGRTLSENVGGEIVSYTYDNNNNQLTMADATGTTTRAYDELNRVTSKTVPVIGTTQFLYDQTSGLTAGYISESYSDPKGNTVIKISDKEGRLYQVKDGANITTYTYYANGNLQTLEYPNGAKEEYDYYANNKLHTLANKQGMSILEAFSYDYDSAGNMTGKADRKGTTNYTYDALNRIDTVTEPNAKETSYEYDAAGNRTSESVTEGNTVTRTEYTYNSQNRLVTTNKLINTQDAGGIDYGFDYNGNVISVMPYTITASAITTSAMTVGLSALGNSQNQSITGTAIYEYDNRNQMIKAVSEGNAVENTYNGDGLRVSKSVNGETSNYLYEYDKIILETDNGNSEKAQNIYGTNLINRSAGSDSMYYLYNGHGDVTNLQSASGTTAAQYYYDAFGTPTEVTGSANNPFRYAGYEYDDETDLYYLKARMYDSVTARFMQEDTYRGKANDPLSLNLYTYCHNNPVIYDDPSGHGLFLNAAVAVATAIGAVIRSGSSSSSGSSGGKGSSGGTSSSGSSGSTSTSTSTVATAANSSTNSGSGTKIINPFTILNNVIQHYFPNSVKATNNVSGTVTPPEGSLRWFVEVNGGGTIEQDANDPTVYHATVGAGTPNEKNVDYRLINGVLYDKKTGAIVGKPVNGSVMVTGNYYNSFFGAGTGYAEHTVQNIGGKDYVVYKVGNQTFYANGNLVGNPVNNSTANNATGSAKDIQEAFQNSIRGGDFDNKNGLQCVDLTKWFIATYTTLQWAPGSGWAQAPNTADKNGLSAPSSTPKAWSVFSVAPGYVGWGSRGTEDGHTGIVLSVDEVNKTCTVIQTGHSFDGKTPNTWIAKYSYPNNAVTFTYIGDYMK